MSPVLAPLPPAGTLQRYGRLALVNVISNITVPLVGLVDTAMLGHLEEISFLAGVALASVLFDYLYWGLGFLRMATTGTTAQAVGRGEPHEVALSLYRPLGLGLVLGGLVLLLRQPAMELGFWLLSGSPAVEAAGRSYFAARIWGAPAALCNLALVGWFLGREQSGRALAVTAVANLANVALNYLFIIRLGLAAQGAGIASALSQYAMLALALLLARGGLLSARLPEILEPRALRALVQLNRDIFVRSLLLTTAFALFTNVSALLGTTVLAANAILLRVLTFAAFVIDGAAFATESLAGIFHGEADRPALAGLLRLSLWVGEGCALLLLLPTLLFARPAFALLTTHQDVVEIALAYVGWLLPVLGFGAAAYMLDGFFLGLTAGPTLRNAMLLSTLVVFLPLVLLAVELESNHLLWGSMAMLMISRAATLGWAASVRLAPAPEGGKGRRDD